MGKVVTGGGGGGGVGVGACVWIVLNIPRDTCSCCGDHAGAALSARDGVNCAANQ